MLRFRRVPRPLAALLLLTWPFLVFAQNAAGLTDNLPQSSTFWGAFLTVVALPFLGKALNLVVELAIAWGRSKGVKRIDTYAYLYNLGRAAVAYVDAHTQAERTAIMADGKVTAEEAGRLQALAVQTVKDWLGTQKLEDIAKDLGITVEGITSMILGVVQHAFDDKKVKEQLAEPGTPDAAAVALAKAGLVPRDAPTEGVLVGNPK